MSGIPPAGTSSSGSGYQPLWHGWPSVPPPSPQDVPLSLQSHVLQTQCAPGGQGSPPPHRAGCILPNKIRLHQLYMRFSKLLTRSLTQDTLSSTRPTAYLCNPAAAEVAESFLLERRGCTCTSSASTHRRTPAVCRSTGSLAGRRRRRRTVYASRYSHTCCTYSALLAGRAHRRRTEPDVSCQKRAYQLYTRFVKL